MVLLQSNIQVHKKCTGLDAVLLREFIKQLASLLALVDETPMLDSCSDSARKCKKFEASCPVGKILSIDVARLFGFFRSFVARLTFQLRLIFNCLCFCLSLWRFDAFVILFRGKF